jgi:hypothetical protein
LPTGQNPERIMTEAEWHDGTDPFTLYEFLRTETVTHRTRWQGWLTVRRFSISERRLRLFAYACCARVEHLLPVDQARSLLLASEAYADGCIGDTELEAAERSCEAAIRREGQSPTPWLRYEHEAVAAVTLVHRTEAVPGRLGAIMAAGRARAGAAVWRRHVDSLGGVLRVKPEEFAPLEEVVRTCDRFFLSSERAAEAARQAELLRDIVGNPFRPVHAEPDWLAWHDGVIVRLAQTIYDGRRFQDLPVLGDALEDAGCTDVEILSHCRGGGLHVRGCRVIDILTGRG